MIGEHLTGTTGAAVTAAETIAGLEPETRDTVASVTVQESEDAASDYWDDEMQEFEETREDPAGAFWENLQFGLTGPAPSLNSDLSIDHGDGPIGAINRTAWDGLEDATGVEAGDPGDAPWWAQYAVLAVVASFVLMLFSYTVGQLVTFEV